VDPSIRIVLPRGIAIVALAVVGLNLADAFFTLRHIELGAVEMNPLMQQLLDQGPLAFVAGKHLLVGAGVIVAAAHCGRRAARGALQFLVLPAYAMTVSYQLILLALVL
jgi:hypothetical protein